jgi:hypothetical protein
VLENIDVENREILIRAYVGQHIYSSDGIEDLELHKFYDANPPLFSARKIYHGVVFNLEQGPLAAGVVADLDRAHSADAIRATRTQLLLLTGVEDSPLSFDQVSDEIGRFLTTRRNQAALKANLQQLQAASKIEYVSARSSGQPGNSQ